MTPLQALRHHVTGAIQRGEKAAIVGIDSAMLAAMQQARAEMPIIGWYDATENAALDHGVSLPELQRNLQKS